MKVEVMLEDEGLEGITAEEIGRVRSRPMPTPTGDALQDDEPFCTGKGTMRQRRPGYWELRFSLCEGGERYRRSVTIRGTRKMAEEALDEFVGAHRIEARAPDPASARAWIEQAACRTEGLSHFFPSIDAKNSAYAFARIVCARCPVTAECLDYALKNDATSGRFGGTGMWGGKTPDERRAILNRERQFIVKQGWEAPVKTHCPKGHELDLTSKRPRLCRTCHNERDRQLRKQRKVINA